MTEEKSKDPSNNEEGDENAEKAVADDRDDDAAGTPLPVNSSEPRQPNIVGRTNYVGGWFVLKYKTPKGRVYSKFCNPDGDYWFSEKQAKENGFKNEPLEGDN